MYLRATMTTIEDSSYKDIVDAISDLGVEADFKIIKNRIINKITGSVITFKGIRSTSGSKLKSLSGFTTVVIEEAMDVESFEDFSEVDEGIRVIGKPLKIIFLYNPGIALGSFLHDDWFVDGVPNPRRLKDTAFMHSTFLDNEKNLNESTVVMYKDMEFSRPKYYVSNILAEWSLDAEGRVYENWPIYKFMENQPEFTIYGLDFGYGGNDATACIKIDYFEGAWYGTELFSKPKMRIGETIAEMKNHGVPLNAKIYADYAVPTFLTEIRLGGFTGIRKCRKGKVEVELKKMQDKNIIIIDPDKTSQLYFGHMTWKRDKNGKLQHEPDSLAAFRYGILSCNPNTDKPKRGRPARRRSGPKSFLRN